MAGITFSRERTWLYARWVANGFLETVQRAAGDRHDITAAIEQGIALDGLHLDMLETELREDILLLLEQVARDVIDGKHPVEVDGRILDDKSQSQYRDAVKALLKMLDEHQPSRAP